MARIKTRMATPNGSLCLSTLLSAMCQRCILTITGAMASLSAKVQATSKLLPTHFAAGHGCRPARLVVQILLAAHTLLLNQVRALGTRLIVTVTRVIDLGMTASLWAPAWMRAGRRLRATGLRRIENCLPTVASNLLEYRLSAAATWASVAQVLA